MKLDKAKKVASRVSEILEIFSYFNLIPAIIPLLFFGIEELHTSIYFIVQGIGMLIISMLLKNFAGEENLEELPFHYNVVAIFSGWILVPLLSSFVYIMSGLSPLDAYFESLSAWTTTGFTVYSNLAEVPPQIIFWRSFEQWIGGLGIVAFVFFLLEQNTNLFSFSKAEGRTEFIKPTMKGTLKTILKIYLIFTFIGTALLSFTGLDLFTSLNITMTAIPTGGFIPTETLNLDLIQTGILILMMIFGATPFFIHYNTIKGKFGLLKQYRPLHLMILFIGIIALLGMFNNVDSVNAVFHAVSAMTNAGFSTIELNSNLGSYFYGLIILMLVGGCLGSTAGAIKIDRILILIKGIKWKIEKALNPPNAIVIERFMNYTIKDEHITNAAIVLILHLSLFVVSSFILDSYVGDISNSMFEVASAMGNVGLSTGIINAALPDVYKILFMFLMVVGRLEVLTFFIFLGALYKATR
uniref:Potassium transporter (TrkH) n=1 Tax=uncultured marine group II/III euryarchaeote KM3_195_B08 TaxID=1457970 RepID=A0A075GWV0_9EURY|nr:potassium transporter (trkH) [uncultured marine group II/III euryarchaeote KM3_195_B08]